MTKHTSIKTVCVSIFILFLAITGNLQNASAESLNSAYGFGSATTASTTLVNTGISATVDASNSKNVLVVTTFTGEMDTIGVTDTRDATYRITDNSASPNVSGEIQRTLDRIDGNDKGIGSLVYIFGTATTFSGSKTYTLQHRTSDGTLDIKTTGTIVAIPLVTDTTTTPLLNVSSQINSPDDAPEDNFEAVIGTTTTAITTAAPGDFYVAASIQSYKTGGGANDVMGEWKLQYSISGGSWNDLGYVARREISSNTDNGIINLMALLPNQSASTQIQFRVAHRENTDLSTGIGTIYTHNTSLVAVYTGFNDGSSDQYFPIYEAYAPSSSTTTSIPSYSEAVGFDFTPTVNTDLFMHAQYSMEADGQNTPAFDLFVDNGIFDGQDQQRLIANATDVGSGASVGLAQSLTAATPYRVSLRHAVNPSGQELTTNNPTLIMWDLNTGALTADLSVTKDCADLAPGANDALAYTITVSNSGPDTSPVINLTDVIPAGVGGDLTDVKYAVGDTIPPATGIPWPGAIALESIPPGGSQTVRIYADIPSTLTSIASNTAIVTSIAFDPTGDNSPTCTNEVLPAVTINQAAGQADPTNGSPINFTVVFSKTVTGFGDVAADVTLGGDAPGTLTATVTGSGSTYNVAVSGMTGSGTVIATIPAGVAQDGLGNDNIASTSTDNEVTYDTTAPVLSSFALQTPATSPTSADTLIFRATFDKAVTAIDNADFAVNSSTTATISSVATADGGAGLLWDITVSGGDLSTFEGEVGIDLAGGQDITDLAGNALPAGEPATDASYTLINSVPTNITDPSDAEACDGSPVSFSSNADGATSIQWEVDAGFGFGTVPAPAGTTNPLTFTAALSQDGNIYKAVFANAFGTASSNPATLTVSTLPNAPSVPTATANPICAGTSTTLSSTVNAGETIDWYTGGCGVSGGGTIVPLGTGVLSIDVTPSGNTTYHAQARNSTTGCLSATCSSILVTVNLGDTITMTSAADTDDQTLYTYTGVPVLTDITYDTTGATGIVDSGIDGANGLPAGVSATWASDTVTISGTPTERGTFAYTITTINGLPCSATATGTITVLIAPPTDDRLALDFIQDDGDKDYVHVLDDNTLDLTASGTLEAWIYPDDFATGAGIVYKGTANTCYGFGFGDTVATSQNIAFYVFGTTGTEFALTATDKTIEANQWYHIACVWNSAASPYMSIYINGIASSETRTTPFPDAIRENDEELRFGVQTVTSAYYQGVIEEVRVWNVARPLETAGADNDIRDFMCKKLTGFEIGLAGYWRLDENNSLIVGDWAGNGNIGIITNAERICSAAPIGDDSAFDYTGTTFSDFTVNLAYGALDNMDVTGDGGTWDAAEDSCLHVYRVDSPPNYTSASLLWKPFTDSLRYWGVFKAGGTLPTYTMVYDYAGYPGITNENNLNIAARNNNCDQWKGLDATLSTTDNTLTLTGLSGTEFILGADVDPRNTILYDGTNDYVEVADDASLRLTTDGSLEAWIYITAYQTNAGIISKGDTSDGYILYTDATTGNNILFSLYESAGPSSTTVTSTTALSTATWYHIVATWDGTDMNLYINGVLDQTQSTTQATGDTTGSNLNIGLDNSNYFYGQIDEVRVWDVARNQTQIQANMCQKIDTRDANIVGYWRFDEETTSDTSFDFGTTPYNPATMYGFGTATDIIAARVCSAAPIGDDSVYDYGTTTPVSATIAHPDGDYFFASSNGTWANAFAGIQVYRVDGPPVYPPDISGPLPYNPYVTPNGLTPPAGWSSVDYYRYWGIFITDWTAGRTYDAIYHYGTAGSGNPSVPANADGTAGNPQLGLAYRPAYCFGTWTDSTANWAFGTSQLELTNANGKAQSQNGPPKTNPEYVLGGINQPLAIALASFTAAIADDCIEISWETATEVDTLGFQIWRSESKDGPYTLLSSSFTASKSVTESQGATYSFTDCNVVLDKNTDYYYKLEEIDLDTDKGNPLYGPIGPVAETVSASQVGSAAAKSSDDGCFINSLRQ